MTIDDNPFERWNLDPSADLRSLTKTMRQRIAELGEEEAQALQHQWRKLTSDPVQRARWIALTPPPVSKFSEPWSAARQLARGARPPGLTPLEPTLDDALVLPLFEDEGLYAPPPFLPAILSKGRRFGTKEKDQE